MTFEQFAADERTVDAVVRNFILIGEAAGHISPEVRVLDPDIPWRLIRGMRNIATHAYFAVSLPIVWQTLSDDLEPLVPRLEALLAREEGGASTPSEGD